MTLGENKGRNDPLECGLICIRLNCQFQTKCGNYRKILQMDIGWTKNKQ